MDKTKKADFQFPTAAQPVVDQPVEDASPEPDETSIDQGVEESFPASDPVSVSITKVVTEDDPVSKKR